MSCRSSRANGPICVERTGADASGHGVEIGIGEHDGGVLASHLTLHVRAARRRGLGDSVTDRNRTRERDRGDVGMLDQGRARLRVADHELEDAFRDVLPRDLVEHLRGPSRLRRRLQHRRVP